jgi:hypothetical protein
LSDQHSARLTMRLTEEELNWIKFLAAMQGCSDSEAVRRILNTMRMILATGNWDAIYNQALGLMEARQKN